MAAEESFLSTLLSFPIKEELEVESWEKCIICSSLLCSSFSLAPRIVPENLDPNKTIGEQLWSIFVLKNVLQLPDMVVAELFERTNGTNPDSWFKVCDSCCQSLNQAFLVHGQIVKLEWELEQWRKTIRGTVKNSLGMENETYYEDYSPEFSARKCVREYFRACIPIPPPPMRADVNFDLAYQVDAVVEEMNDEILTEDVEMKSEDIDTFNHDEDLGWNERNNTVPIVSNSNEIIEAIDDVINFNQHSTKVNQPGVSRKTDQNFVENPPVSPVNLFNPLPLSLHKCDICGRELKDKRSLHNHKHSQHLVPPQVIKCENCENDFETRAKLQTHKREAHSDLFKWKCDLCDAMYTRSNKLRQHTELVHLDKRFICKKCGQEFRCYAYLRAHLLHPCEPMEEWQ